MKLRTKLCPKWHFQLGFHKAICYNVHTNLVYSVILISDPNFSIQQFLRSCCCLQDFMALLLNVKVECCVDVYMAGLNRKSQGTCQTVLKSSCPLPQKDSSNNFVSFSMVPSQHKMKSCQNLFVL